jgi:protein O-mannosyl-transferase
MIAPTRRMPLILLLLAMALSVAVYWTGLHGPFLFDDGPNFSVIKSWLEGKAGLDKVLFGNTSWFTHRSLAMGSFALGVKLFGYTPFVFKLGNLLLHLACGAIAYRVLTLLAQRDPLLAPRAAVAAVAITIVWLLHPFNASTVLYAVQRMSQLAALCCLLGLWLYISLRGRLETGPVRLGWTTLFIGIPLLTALGIQGKQNAAALPALCLVIELAYFRMPRAWPRPLVAFYFVLLALPALALAIGLMLRPDLLLRGYAEYPFTLSERLLSEARVMGDYVRMLLLPNPPAMGVYTDDYAPSRGLFTPPTTALGIILLMTASILAWRARRIAPSVFAGWFFFLTAHSVEGTILPIELYYEHRNYLPALGLFLACAALIAMSAKKLASHGIRVDRIGVAVGLAILLMLTLQTHGRARVWSDIYVLAESALEGHPDSARAVLNYVGLAMDSGDSKRAYAVLDRTITHSADPELRGLARLFRIRIDCELHGSSSTAELARAIDSLPHHVDLTMVQVMGYTRHLIERKQGCLGISQRQFADALVATVDRAKLQPDASWAKWMLRYRAAGLYAAEQDWDNALAQARLAWQPNVPPPVAELLVDALLRHGSVNEAVEVYREAEARSNIHVSQEAQGLAKLRAKIDGARASRSP